jgi:hypothetical protein
VERAKNDGGVGVIGREGGREGTGTEGRLLVRTSYARQSDQCFSVSLGD